MDSEQEMQSKLIELEMLKQQIGQLDKQGMEINAKIMDVNAAVQTLGDLEKHNGNADALVPIGSGMFLKAALQDPKNVVVNVGADVAVMKPTSSAKAIMTDIKEKYEKMLMEIENEMIGFQTNAQRLYSQLEQAQSSRTLNEDNSKDKDK
ncbi:MAG: prefoldin subunit alpha [archaeon]|nr:prefoldin subunit alpha [archaeon]